MAAQSEPEPEYDDDEEALAPPDLELAQKRRLAKMPQVS
eukprot:COSAG05_NODE_361_length_10793_cov_141.983262_5_plen_39_part_00